MTAILLFGKNGQVGAELCASLAALGELTASGRNDVDLSKPDAIRSTLRRLKPQLVVNAAAYTAVDDAEGHRDEAYALNCEAPRIMAEELVKWDGVLIHYSTDYVFDGAKSTPYMEDDPAHPINVYGASKLAGERALAAGGVSYLILRTSWVYGHAGRNFVNTVAGHVRAGRPIRAVSDQTGSPTWARTVARATQKIIEKCGSSLAGMHETCHLAAAGAATRYELALKIAQLIAVNDRATAKVQAARSSEFPTAAARPAYSALSSRKVTARFGVELPRWDADLDAYFRAQPPRVNTSRDT